MKSSRVLELYQEFLSGKVINKQDAADRYQVNVRSIQRDIDTIRDFLSDQCAKQGIARSIEYDRAVNGYRLVTQEVSQLTQGEALALCKIILESRALTKEQLKSCFQAILTSCVLPKEEQDVEWFIANELYYYHDPAHPTIDLQRLWTIAQAVRSQTVVEIDYLRLKDKHVVKRRVKPVGLMFSEYYFYMMAVIADEEPRKDFDKKDDPYPTIYRLDRIQSVRLTGETFSVLYREKFKEGEYKNRVQYMYGGEPQQIDFEYYGPSVEAVLDRFPMAKIVDEKEGVYSIKAEVFGSGVMMWLLSQGSQVRVAAPDALVEKMRIETEKMQARYRQEGE